MNDNSYFYYDVPSHLLSGTVSSSVTLAALFGLFFVLLAFLIKNPEHRARVATIVLGLFLFKVLIIFGNESLHLLKRKPAGNFSLWFFLYAQDNGFDDILNGRVFPTFLVQFFINFPSLWLFGVARENLLLTNAFFTSAAGVYAFYGLRSIFGFRAGFVVLLLLGIYPASINFSMFGLRDPVIYFFMTVNIVSLLRFYLINKNWALIGIGISFYMVFSLRPELLAFLFVPYGLFILNFLYRLYLTSKTPKQRVALTGVYSIFILIPGLVFAFIVYTFVTSQIGAYGVSPIEIVTTFASNRYDREMGIGDGSHIVPPHIYHSIPWYARWGIQSLGMIVLPFPWLITSIPKVLAAMDSFYIIILLFTYRSLIKNYYIQTQRISITTKEQQAIKALIITFFVSVGVMGFIVNNAGNAFRMRISIFPYVGIAAGIVIGLYFKYRSKAKKQLVLTNEK